MERVGPKRRRRRATDGGIRGGPAQESLEAGPRAALSVQDRLIGERQLVALESPVKAGFYVDPGGDFAVHGLPVETVRAQPQPLDLEQRRLRVLDEKPRLVAVLRAHGDADADADENLGGSHPVTPGNPVEDSL